MTLAALLLHRPRAQPRVGRAPHHGRPAHAPVHRGWFPRPTRRGGTSRPRRSTSTSSPWRSTRSSPRAPGSRAGCTSSSTASCGSTTPCSPWTRPATPKTARPWSDLRVIPLGKGTRPIRLERVSVDGEQAWVFSADTVRAIDRLYAEHGPPLGGAAAGGAVRPAVLGRWSCGSGWGCFAVLVAGSCSSLAAAARVLRRVGGRWRS